MKIILTRPPGNFFLTANPFWGCFLPLLCFVSFPKMELFHHRGDPNLFPDLDNGAVEEGDNNKILLKLPYKRLQSGYLQ